MVSTQENYLTTQNLLDSSFRDEVNQFEAAEHLGQRSNKDDPNFETVPDETMETDENSADMSRGNKKIAQKSDYNWLFE